MKFNFVFLIFTILLVSVFADEHDLQPPEEVPTESSEKPKSFQRKAAKGLDEETSAEIDKNSADKIDDDDSTESFIKIMAEDLNFPHSGIKIIKAPDLSKDNEGKKITEALSMMLENQEKWIQKIEEELEEINKNENSEIPIEREKTAEEIEGNKMKIELTLYYLVQLIFNHHDSFLILAIYF